MKIVCYVYLRKYNTFSKRGYFPSDCLNIIIKIFLSYSTGSIDDFGDDSSKSPSAGVPIPGQVRNLIVKRDPDTGYGLTLSGDQPVFVQTVKPGGSAYRAGVRENDLILKVNGQPVITDATHNQVVAMIQGKGKITYFHAVQDHTRKCFSLKIH